MVSFRLLLLAMTAVIVVVTVSAMGELGLPAAVTTILNDLRHPWRLQFYSDLEIQLVLFACWIIYREQSKLVGVCCGLGAIILGALFTAPYVLIASFRTSGDAVALLIGGQRAGRLPNGLETRQV